MTHRARGGTRRLRQLVAVAVSLAFVAAACGGDDDSSTDPVATTEAPATTDAPSDTSATTDAPSDTTATTDAPSDTTATTDAPVDSPTGRLVIGFEADPTVIDPYFATNYTARSTSQAMFDPLIMERDGSFVPVLAESYEVIDDQTIEFVLRQNVTFHNGEVFDAEAVRYNVERMLSPETDSHQLPRFETIDEVQIIDDYTVRITLTEPDAQIIDAITHLYIVAPAYDAEVGLEGFAAAPVGTGPFTFVSYTPEDNAVFAANLDYFDGSPKGKPLVADLEFRFIPEATTRVAELNTGGIHIAYPLGSDQIASVEGAGGSIVSYNDYSIRMIQLNVSSSGPIAEAATGAAAEGFEALQDPRVRLALNLAIDRDAIVESLLGGRATPIGQPYAAGSFAAPANPPTYDYDPDRAIELLEEAGYGGGLQLDLLANVTHSSDEITLVLDYLSAIGVSSERQTLESGVYNEGWIDGQWPHMRFASWGTPETVLGLMVETDALLSSYSNAEIDALIEEQRTTVDPDARSEVLGRLTAAMHEDPIFVYLWSMEAIAGLHPDVSGWQPHPSFIPATDTRVG